MSPGRLHEREMFARADNHRVHLDAAAGCQLLRLAAGDIHLPEMPMIDIALVGSNYHEASIR